MDIRNKIAIITGASSGIGLATARLFSKKGAMLALAARSSCPKLPDSIIIRADITKPADIRRIVKQTLKHFGRIDILINNAGRGYDSLVTEIDFKKWQYIIDLDLFGPVRTMQAVIPVMKKQRGGVIVNISSGTALMVLPSMSPYSSIKSALSKLSQTAREELANEKIAVSVVYPYITATKFERNTLKSVRNTGEEEWDNTGIPPPDPPEHVARMILEAVETRISEIFAHDWMAKNRR